MKIARFEVLTASLQNIQVFWDVSLYQMVSSAYQSTKRNVLEDISPNYNFICKEITKKLGGITMSVFRIFCLPTCQHVYLFI